MSGIFSVLKILLGGPLICAQAETEFSDVTLGLLGVFGKTICGN